MSEIGKPTLDLPNLDIMRCFAVLFVVVSHVIGEFNFSIPHKLAALGRTGVMVFFVHTCMVLMLSLERRPYPLDFYIRRIFRIYPAAIAVIGVTILFKLKALELNAATGFRYAYPTRLDELYNLLLVQNFRGTLIVGVTWSLPYEMQMYLLLPVLFFYVIRNLSLWTVVSLWAFAFLACLLQWGESPQMSLLLCCLYFLPGIMGYVGLRLWAPIFPSWSFLPFFLSLTAIYLCDTSLYGAAFYCLTLGVMLPRFRQSRSSRGNAIARTVAKYSYGIYLVHTFANYIAIVKLKQMPMAVRLMAVPAITIPLAYLLYHLVEEPMIRVGVALARRAEALYEREAEPRIITVA